MGGEGRFANRRAVCGARGGFPLLLGETAVGRSVTTAFTSVCRRGRGAAKLTHLFACKSYGRGEEIRFPLMDYSLLLLLFRDGLVTRLA